MPPSGCRAAISLLPLLLLGHGAVLAVGLRSYDCSMEGADWEVWPAEQKAWCCAKEGKACNAWDCARGTPDEWHSNKKISCWLLKNPVGGGTPPPPLPRKEYDCEAGFARWERGWSPGKKSWCCAHRSRACEEWNCAEGMSETWPEPKRATCCARSGSPVQGCPGAFSRSRHRFDCLAGLNNWRKGWSPKKKGWCCRHQGQGCDDSWDCNLAPASWSDVHRDYCCLKAARGCPGQEPALPQDLLRPADLTLPPTTLTQLPHDCNVGFASWEMGWTAEKKTWCCVNQHRACDPWHCEEGVAISWTDAKRDWCCQKKGEGCPTTTSLPFDCNAGFAKWEAGWSVEKKAWCCEHTNRACEQWDCAEGDPTSWSEHKRNDCCAKAGRGCRTTTSEPYDCGAGFASWEGGWTPEKKTWCCVYRSVACDPWNCAESAPVAWLSAKQDWCCQKKGQGCPTTTSLPFDCNAGFAKWEAGWSVEKKGWCCKHASRACEQWDCWEEGALSWPEAKKAFCCQKAGLGCSTTTSPPFDCNAGFANWEAGWSVEKKGWCCEHAGRGCDPWDCAEDEPTAWPEAKRGFCCPKTGLGCTSSMSLPFDCDLGFADWEASWSKERKTWCCVKQQRACDPWDCDAGLANWGEEKQCWCCNNRQVGCTGVVGFMNKAEVVVGSGSLAVSSGSALGTAVAAVTVAAVLVAVLLATSRGGRHRLVAVVALDRYACLEESTPPLPASTKVSSERGSRSGNEELLPQCREGE